MDPSREGDHTNKLKGNSNSSGYANKSKKEGTIINPYFRDIVNSGAKSGANPKPPRGGYKKTRRNRRRSAKSRSRKH